MSRPSKTKRERLRKGALFLVPNAGQPLIHTVIFEARLDRKYCNYINKDFYLILLTRKQNNDRIILYIGEWKYESATLNNEDTSSRIHSHNSCCYIHSLSHTHQCFIANKFI